jgi:hypothetical protein
MEFGEKICASLRRLLLLMGRRPRRLWGSRGTGPAMAFLFIAQLALAMRGHSEAVADCGVKAFPW